MKERSMLRGWLLWLMPLMLSFPSPAQVAVPDLDHLVPPAPEAAALTRQATVGGSLYGGTPAVRIPLWTLKGQHMAVGITLSYHSTGMKVAAQAGWTGLGWSLQCGGAVTRTVRGTADDLPGGYLATGTRQLPLLTRSLQPYSSWQPPGDVQQQRDLLLAAAQRWTDLEPDLFSYAFPGHSGTFALRDDSTVLLLTPGDVEITFLRQAGGRIIAWTLTDEQGIRYTFGGSEAACDITRQVDANGNPRQEFISTWHLVRIEDPNAADRFTFYYFNRSVEHRYPVSLLRKGCDYPSWDDRYRYSSSFMEEKHLREVVHDRGGGKVRVTFHAEEKDPYPGGSVLALKEIVVHHPDDEQRSVHFLFRYSYYPGTGCGGPEDYLPPCRRLRLDAVQERAGTEEKPPWLFFYDEQPLPPRGSFAKDLWGYYNGKRNDSPVPAMTVVNHHDIAMLRPPAHSGGACNIRWFLRPHLHLDYAAARAWRLPGADRMPDTVKVMAGILKKIVYPTGGATLLEYEPNKVGYLMYPAGEMKKEVAAGGGGDASCRFSVDPGQVVRLVPLFFRKTEEGTIPPSDRIVVKRVELDTERVVFAVSYRRLLDEAAGKETEYRFWLDKGTYILEAERFAPDRNDVVVGKLYYRQGTYDTVYRVYANDYELRRVTAGALHFPDDSSYAVEKSFSLTPEDDRLVEVSWHFRSPTAPNLVPASLLEHPYTVVQLYRDEGDTLLLEELFPVHDSVPWDGQEGYHWEGSLWMSLAPGSYRMVFRPRVPAEAGYIRVEYRQAVRTRPYAIAGGVRLKRRLDLNELGDTVRVREYSYVREEVDGRPPSGVLLGIPLFWEEPEELYYVGQQPAYDPACFPLEVYSLARAEVPTTQGSHVVYACVSEHIPGNGRTVTWYTSPLDHPDITLPHFPFAENSSFAWARGQVKERRVYAEDGRLRQRQVSRFSGREDTLFLPAVPAVKVVQRDPDNPFSFRWTATLRRGGWLRPLKKEQWQYDTTGLHAFYTSTSLAYDTLHFHLRREVTHTSDGRKVRVEHLRADDLPQDYPGKALLLERHMTGVVVQEERYVDSVRVAGTRTFYGRHGGVVAPDSVQTLEGKQYRTTTWFDRYDPRGHLLQYHGCDRVYHALHWDEWGNPVTTVVNAVYSPQGVYPDGAMVTHYTYDPLAGMTRMAGPDGRTTRYDHDAFGRLVRVWDAGGRIRSAYAYRYRGYDGDTSRPYFVDHGYLASLPADSVVMMATAVVRNCPVTLRVAGGRLGTQAAWYWYRGGCGLHPVDTGETLTVTVARTEKFFVRAEGLLNTTPCRSITLIPGKATFRLSPPEVHVEAAGTSHPLFINTGYTGCEPWQVVSSAPWVTIREKNEDNFSIVVEANPHENERRDTLMLTAGAASAWIAVVQEGRSASEPGLTITWSPSFVQEGTEVTLTATVENCEEPRFTWEIKKDSETGWTPLQPSGDGNPGVVTVTAGAESFSVRCTATCDGMEVTSQVHVEVAQ